MKLRTYGQIAVACIALTSCSVMPAGLLSPMQEEPTDTEESYLERGGGPQSRVELGAGEEHLLTIPMVAGSRSLNLANAVAVVVYDAWRRQGYPGSAGGGPVAEAPGSPPFDG